MTDTLRQNPDGSWSPDQPIPLTDDFDVEVYDTGPWVWTAHRGSNLVAQGRARTRLGLRFAIARAKRRHAKETQR